MAIFSSVTEMLLPAGDSDLIKKTWLTGFGWLTP
jgi:hypothetical protein